MMGFRGLVHALSPGAAHDVGAEDGVCGGEWENGRRLSSAAAAGPSAMLVLRYLYYTLRYTNQWLILIFQILLSSFQYKLLYLQNKKPTHDCVV